MATTSSVYVRTGDDGKTNDVLLVERSEVDGKANSSTRKLGVVVESQPGVFSALLSGTEVAGCDCVKATSVHEVAEKIYEAVVAGNVQYKGNALTAPAAIPDAALGEPPAVQS